MQFTDWAVYNCNIVPKAMFYLLNNKYVFESCLKSR